MNLFRKGKKPMEKFEYKVITALVEKEMLNGEFQTKLNQLGLDGWELVNITSSTNLGSSKYSLIGISIQCIG
ncbi:MAG: DUF4177 domain-containing protein, partial [Anaerorhabdus sp.]